jgi:tetratricopeptide (TPR) repeat protein
MRVAALVLRAHGSEVPDEESQQLNLEDLRSPGTAWLAMLASMNVAFGTASMICIGRDSQYRRALAGVRSIEQRRPPRVTTIAMCVPPTAKAALVAANRDVHIVEPDTLELDALAAVLKTLPTMSVCIISDAARYEPFADDVETRSASAARWAVRAAETFRRAIAIAEERKLALVLDAGELLDGDSAEATLLASLGEPVFGAARPAEFSVEHVHEWAELFRGSDGAHDGRVHELIAARVASPDHRRRIAAIALARAGRIGDAWALVAEEATAGRAKDVPPDALLQWANWAYRSGAGTACEELVAVATSRGDELAEPLLAAALDLAESLGRRDLVAALRALFQARYPSSLSPLRIECRRGRADRRYADAARAAKAILERSPEDVEARMTATLAEEFPRGRYAEAVAAFASDEKFGPLVLRQAVRDLCLDGEGMAALQLTQTARVPSTPSTLRAELDAINAARLRSPPLTRDALAMALASFASRALRVVGHHPEDGELRLDVFDGFASQTTELLGMSVLCGRIADAPPPRVAAAVETVDESAPGDLDTELHELLVTAQNAMTPGRLGRFKAPLPLGKTPNALVTRLVNRAQVAALASDDDEREDVDLTLHIALCALRQHGDPPDGDIRLIRAVATAAAVRGDPQRARDLAEECLVTAKGGSDHRRRLAWLAFADLYLRVGDRERAAFGLACALEAAGTLDPAEALEEMLLRVRFFREMRFYPKAMHVLDRALELVDAHGPDGERYKLEFLKLQIETTATLSDGASPSELIDLASAVAAFVHARSEAGDYDLIAPASLLGELRQRLVKRAIPVPSEVDAAAAAARRGVPEVVHSRLDRLSAAAPGLTDLTRAARELGATRSRDDLDIDAGTAIVVARRGLAVAVDQLDTSSGLFALELMAEPSTIGGLKDATPDDLRAILERAHQMGADVHMLGCDADRRVIRLSQKDGVVHAPIVEPGFAAREADTWLRAHLAEIGRQRTPDPRQVYRELVAALAPLSVLLPPSERTSLFVLGRDLLSMPPSLFRHGDAVLAHRTPLAVVPSLHWFKQASERAQGVIDRETLVWIPESSTLDGALDKLAADIFRRAATAVLPLHRGASPPKELSTTDVAVIGIHGSVGSAGGAAGIVRDDAGLGRHSQDLADHAGKARIVVLLSCHGGRIASLPFGHGQTGFVRQCLDAGALCVVAPLWALPVRTASRWLAEFLARWRRGYDVARASLEAACVIRALLPYPADWLAMQVYGNPFVSPAMSAGS